MIPPPRQDADVPAYLSALGLPGLIDVHVHFMPHNVLRKVWAYFDGAGPLVGREWPIRYRGDDAERLEQLRSMEVKAFPSLVYAHKPGMSAWLNAWSLDFAATVPEVITTGTFFPEEGVLDYVQAGLEAGVRLWKAHVQVGAWDPRDERLTGVWAALETAGTPIIAHVGSGPAPGEFTGPGPISEVLERFPLLPLVVAHMGMPDVAEFCAVADRFERVRLDTTMAFTDFTGARTCAEAGVSADLVERLGHEGKILWGSDFPNLPYSYAHGIEALVGLGLGDEWMRQVLWHAPAGLLDVEVV